jgi:hypothetical protein
VGLIEAILLGLQFKNLQKPFVFFSMLIGFLFFSLAGFGMFYGIYEIVISNKTGNFLPVLGVLAFSILFFGLAGVCGYMIKRCFK